MDINGVYLSGRLYDINKIDTGKEYPMVTARLSVNVGYSKENGAMFDEFDVKCYGKTALFASELPNGTFVSVTGKLKEDLHVDPENPAADKSSTHVIVDLIKTVGNEGIKRSYEKMAR